MNHAREAFGIQPRVMEKKTSRLGRATSGVQVFLPPQPGCILLPCSLWFLLQRDRLCDIWLLIL